MRPALVLVTCMVVAGCSAPEAPRSAQGPATGPGVASPSATIPAPRPVTRPPTPIVSITARGPGEQRIRTAIKDLKETGLWRMLTRDHHSIGFAAEPGRASVPDDGHLADAIFRSEVPGSFARSTCDVVFYPTALTDDLDRWGVFHQQGLLGPPPDKRHFWAAIMSHELAHCLVPDKGERAAIRWENKTLAALGSPARVDPESFDR